MKKDPKIFGDYQNPLRLLEDLRDCEVKLGGNESVDQKIKIKNIILFLTYEKKLLIFFRDCSLWLSEDRANY